jgi:hypothetical protein
MGNSTVSTKSGNERINGVFISCFNRIGIKYFDGGTVVCLGDVLVGCWIDQNDKE